MVVVVVWETGRGVRVVDKKEDINIYSGYVVLMHGEVNVGPR